MVNGVVADPNDYRNVFVIDGSNVYNSADTGATWKSITGNLPRALSIL